MIPTVQVTQFDLVNYFSGLSSRQVFVELVNGSGSADRLPTKDASQTVSWSQPFRYNPPDPAQAVLYIIVWDAVKQTSLRTYSVDIGKLFAHGKVKNDIATTLYLPLSSNLRTEGKILWQAPATDTPHIRVGLTVSNFTLQKTEAVQKQLQVKVVSGQNLKPNKGQEASTCEPLCVLRVGSQTHRTTTKKGYNPKWEEQFIFDVEDTQDLLTVAVMNKDTKDRADIGLLRYALDTLRRGVEVQVSVPLVYETQETIVMEDDTTLTLNLLPLGFGVMSNSASFEVKQGEEEYTAIAPSAVEGLSYAAPPHPNQEPSDSSPYKGLFILAQAMSPEETIQKPIKALMDLAGVPRPDSTKTTLTSEPDASPAKSEFRGLHILQEALRDDDVQPMTRALLEVAGVGHSTDDAPLAVIAAPSSAAPMQLHSHAPPPKPQQVGGAEAASNAAPPPVQQQQPVQYPPPYATRATSAPGNADPALKPVLRDIRDETKAMQGYAPQNLDEDKMKAQIQRNTAGTPSGDGFSGESPRGRSPKLDLAKLLEPPPELHTLNALGQTASTTTEQQQPKKLLQVTLHEGFNLLSADGTAPHSVYVEFNFNNSHKSQSSLQSGMAPVWGNTYTFPVDNEFTSTLYIAVCDNSDPNGLGAYSLHVGRLNLQNDDPYDVWIPILYAHAQDGQIVWAPRTTANGTSPQLHLTLTAVNFLSRPPSPSLMSGKSLKVFLNKAADLTPNTLTSHKPVCELKIGSITYRSGVRLGTNPVWEEEFDFPVEDENAETLTICIFFAESDDTSPIAKYKILLHGLKRGHAHQLIAPLMYRHHEGTWEPSNAKLYLQITPIGFGFIDEALQEEVLVPNPTGASLAHTSAEPLLKRYATPPLMPAPPQSNILVHDYYDLPPQHKHVYPPPHKQQPEQTAAPANNEFEAFDPNGNSLLFQSLWTGIPAPMVIQASYNGDDVEDPDRQVHPSKNMHSTYEKNYTPHKAPPPHVFGSSSKPGRLSRDALEGPKLYDVDTNMITPLDEQARAAQAQANVFQENPETYYRGVRDYGYPAVATGGGQDYGYLDKKDKDEREERQKLRDAEQRDREREREIKEKERQRELEQLERERDRAYQEREKERERQRELEKEKEEQREKERLERERERERQYEREKERDRERERDRNREREEREKERAREFQQKQKELEKRLQLEKEEADRRFEREKLEKDLRLAERDKELEKERLAKEREREERLRLEKLSEMDRESKKEREEREKAEREQQRREEAERRREERERLEIEQTKLAGKREEEETKRKQEEARLEELKAKQMELEADVRKEKERRKLKEAEERREKERMDDERKKLELQLTMDAKKEKRRLQEERAEREERRRMEEAKWREEQLAKQQQELREEREREKEKERTKQSSTEGQLAHQNSVLSKLEELQNKMNQVENMAAGSASRKKELEQQELLDANRDTERKVAEKIGQFQDQMTQMMQAFIQAQKESEGKERERREALERYDRERKELLERQERERAERERRDRERDTLEKKERDDRERQEKAIRERMERDDREKREDQERWRKEREEREWERERRERLEKKEKEWEEKKMREEREQLERLQAEREKREREDRLREQFEREALNLEKKRIELQLQKEVEEQRWLQAKREMEEKAIREKEERQKRLEEEKHRRELERLERQQKQQEEAMSASLQEAKPHNTSGGGGVENELLGAQKGMISDLQKQIADMQEEFLKSRMQQAQQLQQAQLAKEIEETKKQIDEADDPHIVALQTTIEKLNEQLDNQGKHMQELHSGLLARGGVAPTQLATVGDYQTQPKHTPRPPATSSTSGPYWQQQQAINNGQLTYAVAGSSDDESDDDTATVMKELQNSQKLLQAQIEQMQKLSSAQNMLGTNVTNLQKQLEQMKNKEINAIDHQIRQREIALADQVKILKQQQMKADDSSDDDDDKMWVNDEKMKLQQERAALEQDKIRMQSLTPTYIVTPSKPQQHKSPKHHGRSRKDNEAETRSLLEATRSLEKSQKAILDQLQNVAAFHTPKPPSNKERGGYHSGQQRNDADFRLPAVGQSNRSVTHPWQEEYIQREKAANQLKKELAKSLPSGRGGGAGGHSSKKHGNKSAAAPPPSHTEIDAAGPKSRKRPNWIKRTPGTEVYPPLMHPAPPVPSGPQYHYTAQPFYPPQPPTQQLHQQPYFM